MLEIDYDELERINTEMMHDSAFRELSNRLVPGEGDNPIAFIIGEAPGAQEALRRKPFVGPAGRVQRQLMSFAGLWAAPELSHSYMEGCQAQPNCWLTNVIKFRPPRNRKPYWVEIMAARPYLKREWVAVGSPRLIITVGGTALSAVLGRQSSVLKVSGKPEAHGNTWLWPMIHPSFGLRQPAMQALIEQDWNNLAVWMRDANYQ